MYIVITGASQGIGYELTKVLAKHKQNHLVVISRNGSHLRELVAECVHMYPEAKVIPYEFDLTQFDFYPFIVQRIETFIPRCDILVHNAGKLICKPFGKISQQEFDDVYNVNIKAPYFFTQAMLPMMNKGGHIVHISSAGAIPGSKKFPGLTAYSSSKGALTIFSEVLAEELAEMEISVNCLAIGAVQTEMFSKAFPGAKALQSPGQIAHFIGDFCVNGNKYFNGKVLPVALSVP